MFNLISQVKIGMNIKADGKDLSFVTVRVVDKEGNVDIIYQ